MDLASRAIWAGGDLLIACLLYRGWRGKALVRYPWFFCYVAVVCASTVLRTYLQATASPHTYAVGYWGSEFLSYAAGFGVTWEIYAVILAPYAGVRRMARAVLGVLFAAVLAKALAEVGVNPVIQVLGPTTLELERNLRVLQTILLLAMVALVVHYSLPMGRNSRAMLVGYGLYIGCVVIALTLRSQAGTKFEPVKDAIQRTAYLGSLLIWCRGLWVYEPNPSVRNLIEEDYERICARTANALGRMRQHVIQAWRP